MGTRLSFPGGKAAGA